MPLLLSLSSLLSMPLLLYFWPGRAKNRGDSRFTFVHETAGSRLLFQLFPQRVEFTGDRVLRLVRPGRYANTRALQKLRNVGGSICYPCPTRQINHTVGAFDRLVFDFVGIDRDSRRRQSLDCRWQIVRRTTKFNLEGRLSVFNRAARELCDTVARSDKMRVRQTTANLVVAQLVQRQSYSQVIAARV